MEYIADIILVVLFSLMVVIGVKKGFAKSVLDIIGTVAALALSYVFSKPLATFLYDNIADGMIKDALQKKFEGQLSSAVDMYSEITDVISSIPEGLVNLASKVGVDISGLTEKMLSLEVTNETVLATVADTVIKPVVLTVMALICCVLIFIVASIVLQIVIKLIDKVFKLPVLGTVNKVLGAVLGIVKGVVLVVVICLSLDIIYGFLNGGTLAQIIDGSKILAFINSRDVFINYLNK